MKSVHEFADKLILATALIVIMTLGAVGISDVIMGVAPNMFTTLGQVLFVLCIVWIFDKA
jgi:hypothetical protein